MIQVEVPVRDQARSRGTGLSRAVIRIAETDDYPGQIAWDPNRKRSLMISIKGPESRSEKASDERGTKRLKRI